MNSAANDVVGVGDAFFFFQAEDGIRDHCVTGVQTCALPISGRAVVTGDGEGPRELFTDGEHLRLVPRDDPGAIANALVELLRSPALRERLGAAGEARAHEPGPLTAGGPPPAGGLSGTRPPKASPPP